jgi:hypothetical protein
LEYFTIKTAHIVSLIQNGLQSLYMDCCMIHPGPSSSMTDAQNNREVARSIATSKTLKQLTLGVFEINVALVCALLQEKEYNCKLDFLALRNSCELDHGNTVLIGNALGQFIRNSPSPLAVLCLHNFDWTGQSFAPIAENVSTAETTLAISGGSMDGASCQEWASLYPPESAAKAFVLSLDVEFPEAEEHQPLTHMVASLPGLTDLVLRTKESAAATGIQRDSLLAITKGLVSTKCPLKKLTFANAFPDSLCEILIKALPFFCSLEYLKLHLSTDSDKGEFMKAFQRNRSLKEVSIEGGGFNASDRTRLNVYLERNRCLPMAIQSESSALKHANGNGIPVRRNTATTATSTTNGKIVPALFQITTDSAVTAIGVSHLVGGLLCGEESLGRLVRTSGERSVSGNQGSQSTK